MIMPAMLVITNDIFAYIFGRIFGRTQLIELSPKKTLEGFIGGFISTLAMAILVIINLIKVWIFLLRLNEYDLSFNGIDNKAICLNRMCSKTFILNARIYNFGILNFN